MESHKEIVESLSPIERKIIPLLAEKDFNDLVEKSGLDRVSVLRALEFLNSNKQEGQRVKYKGYTKYR